MAVVVEHVPDGVLDAMGRVPNGMTHAGGDRVREQRRSYAQRRNQQRQSRTPPFAIRGCRARAER